MKRTFTAKEKAFVFDLWQRGPLTALHQQYLGKFNATVADDITKLLMLIIALTIWLKDPKHAFSNGIRDCENWCRKARVEMVSRADIGVAQKNDASPESDADLCRNDL